MIENIVQIPNINGKLLPPIITSTGLKQRDKLSPILFDNLFDDVDQIFDSQCNPVMFNSEISLNQLLYADDMAILSLSYPGSEVPELKQPFAGRASKPSEVGLFRSLVSLGPLIQGITFTRRGTKFP